jgi:hypothetical protein
MTPSAGEFDGLTFTRTYEDGALTPGPEMLEDGTVRRYDNAHEDTKGHERYVAPDPEAELIDFPGIEELYERFWDEIPKTRPDRSETR